MADPLMSIDVEMGALVAALDRLSAESAEAVCLEAARETGTAIKREWASRVRRRTGTFASAITMEDAPKPLGGVRVFVAPMTDPDARYGQGKRPDNFAIWQEYGTKYMTAQPAMGPAVRLEEQPHLRRIAEAVQDAIDAEGFAHE